MTRPGSLLRQWGGPRVEKTELCLQVEQQRRHELLSRGAARGGGGQMQSQCPPPADGEPQRCVARPRGFLG